MLACTCRGRAPPIALLTHVLRARASRAGSSKVADGVDSSALPTLDDAQLEFLLGLSAAEHQHRSSPLHNGDGNDEGMITGRSPAIDAPYWLPASAWRECQRLAKLGSPFGSLADELIAEPSASTWRAWYAATAPETDGSRGAWPSAYGELSRWERALVVRALRPDRLAAALREAVTAALCASLSVDALLDDADDDTSLASCIDAPPVIVDALADASSTAPVIVLVESGDDAAEIRDVTGPLDEFAGEL